MNTRIPRITTRRHGDRTGRLFSRQCECQQHPKNRPERRCDQGELDSFRLRNALSLCEGVVNDEISVNHASASEFKVTYLLEMANTKASMSALLSEPLPSPPRPNPPPALPKPLTS